ncbi:accessory Sec system glycosylation chaperone GtfB [Macrococcoides caseolyticum]|uniref:accessory Sec system glycosylation chaperone GtfB n=1 Tax=Macrococcoides caseolyticum TaxID=69966 RepID=UPI001F45104E|nr:accessory Sec system glycosylation chaperone GtfB [Macrococcus caseolyticus]MCE4957556.1 accessory Sec system glycosylation chaperone GtfB [Macrococcus caseolyticus]
MINLFQQFDEDSIAIYQSQKRAQLNIPTIVIHDDGFLPEDIMTPYRFFANNNPKPIRGRYFNALEVPEYYEISGDNQQARVSHLSDTVARIYYRLNFKRRIIERVEWLDKAQQVVLTEHYNQYGDKFKEINFNESGEVIFERYFNDRNQEVIYINHKTQSITLQYNGQVRSFASMASFLSTYFLLADIDTTSFVINRLSLPLFTVLKQGKGKDILFWQESGDAVPDNMRHILEDVTHRQFKIIVPHRRAYEQLIKLLPDYTQKIKLSGYLYQYMRKWVNTKEVVTLTNSDHIDYLDEIVSACPDYTFHIMAVTEMSSKLKAYMKYKNVKLYPNASLSQMRDIYARSSIYLDINNGNEIMNAVRSAFDYQQVILGFNEVAHNEIFTNPTMLFDKKDYLFLIEKLQTLQQDAVIEAAVTRQRQCAGESNENDFRMTFLSEFDSFN